MGPQELQVEPLDYLQAMEPDGHLDGTLTVQMAKNTKRFFPVQK